MMHVLITGGTGYIGSTAVEIMRSQGVDAVMHFAGKSLVGESVEKPDLYHHVNVDGTRIKPRDS